MKGKCWASVVVCTVVAMWVVAGMARVASAQLFNPPEIVEGVGDLSHTVAAADMNGDGALDLVVANSDAYQNPGPPDPLSDTFQVLINRSTGLGPFIVIQQDPKIFIHVGTFYPAVNYVTGAAPVTVQVADLNGDTFPDVVTASQLADNVWVWHNRGDGTGIVEPEPAQIASVGGTPRFVTVADLDGVGGLDLAVANYDDDNVSVLFNDGSGTFDFNVNYGVGDSPVSIAAADLDGDLDTDLVVANSFSNNIFILFNEGAGDFGEDVIVRPAYAFDEHPIHVVAADLDGDGDQDLAVTTGADNSVSILFNNGEGIFPSRITNEVGGYPEGLVAADFNCDGALDLAFANVSSNDLSVLLNNGDQTFDLDAGGPYAANPQPYAVAAADFDGNGSPDLAVPGHGNQLITSIFLHVGCIFRFNAFELGIYPPHEDFGECCSGPKAQPCWAYFPGADAGAPKCGDPGFGDLINLFNFGDAINAVVNSQGEAEVAEALGLLQLRLQLAPYGPNVVPALQEDANTEMKALLGSVQVPRRHLVRTHRVYNAWDVDLRTPGLEVPTSVPAGTNVSVSLGGGIALTFDHVQSAGMIIPRYRHFGPAIPNGFHALVPTHTVNLESTAGLAPGSAVLVTMDYSRVAFQKGAEVRLFHEENGLLVDRTLSSNPTAQMVTGRVYSFSRFMLLGMGAVTEITCPPDAILQCPADTSPASTGFATATGTGGLISVTFDDSNVPNAAGKSITRTWTATDGFSGAVCQQSIDVVLDACPGACCDHDTFGSCTVTTAMACDCKKCVWREELTCEDIECLHNSIPTVSQWGLVILTLLLLTGAKIYFARRHTAMAS